MQTNFKSCMICLCLAALAWLHFLELPVILWMRLDPNKAAPELFFIGSKLTTPFAILIIKDSCAERICRMDLQKGFGLKKHGFPQPFQIQLI
jgi:hypothetical protein